MVALAWLCIASWPQRALAQPTAALPPVQYEASDACPTRADFLERMRARMSAGTRVPADISLRVRLSAQGGATQGAVEIRRGATNTQRNVDGGRCDEVAEALALIAALALREEDAPAGDTRTRARKTDKPGSPARTHRPARSATGAGSGGEREVGSASAGPDPEERASAADSSARSDPAPGRTHRPARGATGAGSGGEREVGSASAGPDPEEGASAADSSARSDPAPLAGRQQSTVDSAAAGAAADSGVAEAEQPTREDAHPTPWRFGAQLGATAILFSGLAPALQPGLQLQAAVTFSAGSFAWSLQLGGRVARTDALASPDGDARFGFAGGVVRLCLSNTLGATPLTLTGCAVAEPGAFSADGDNTRNGRSHSRLWLAAGAAADLSVRLATWLSVRAGTELLAPVRRDRIVLAGDTLYSVPALGFRWQIGVEVPFG